MREYYEKRRLRQILRSPITLVVLSIILIALVISTSKIYLRAKKATSLRDGIRAELHELESRKSALQSEIEYLQTELGREDEIRTKFNVRRPGEQVIVIVEGEATTTPEVLPQVGFFRRLWNALRD